MRFRTKVPMDDQAREFHFMAFHQRLIDGSLPGIDLAKYDELATEMGFPWKGKDRPFPYQTWLPQTGGDEDYQKVVWQFMVLAERIFLEQIIKFKDCVLVGGKRPRVIVKDGRSTELFVTVCIYIAARQFQRLFELFPEEMAEH